MSTDNRRLESYIYIGLWSVALVLVFLDIMRIRYADSLSLVDLRTVLKVVYNMLPFVLLFAVNNHLLIPRFLKSGRYSGYVAGAVSLVAAVWLIQFAQFAGYIYLAAKHGHIHPPHHGPSPLLPLPLFLDLIYDLLIVGINIAIAMIFQNFSDRLTQERLMKENAQSQLTYLKAQINPHFYLNMLNNIHGMIEIDADRAQDMVIKMSRLMRYMLYDCSRPAVSLSAELDFVRDYIATMRVRYPEDAVGISLSLPDASKQTGVMVPPLIFLVFIENAFKHGISYADRSFVGVSVEVDDGDIIFSCRNSVPASASSEGRHGIGLENVIRRLSLIYGDRFNLTIANNYGEYCVCLKLPKYETEDSDH